jgi:hypothetical protein
MWGYSYVPTPIPHRLQKKTIHSKLFFFTNFSFKSIFVFVCFSFKRIPSIASHSILPFLQNYLSARLNIQLLAMQKLCKCKISGEETLKFVSQDGANVIFISDILYLVKNRKSYYKKIKLLWQHFPNPVLSHINLFFLKWHLGSTITKHNSIFYNCILTFPNNLVTFAMAFHFKNYQNRILHLSSHIILCNCGWIIQIPDFYQEQFKGKTPKMASWVLLHNLC